MPLRASVARFAAVELGDPRHDRVQQLSGRCLIDVLFDRDELRAVALQFEHRVGVVAAVAGEPVDLVEDDVVDISREADAGQHALKLRPVGGLGALAPVEVLLDHLGAQSLGLAQASLALGRQRVALAVGVLVSLLGRGDAQVDHGPLGPGPGKTWCH
jgi:hypothetical protein